MNENATEHRRALYTCACPLVFSYQCYRVKSKFIVHDTYYSSLKPQLLLNRLTHKALVLGFVVAVQLAAVDVRAALQIGLCTSQHVLIRCGARVWQILHATHQQASRLRSGSPSRRSVRGSNVPTPARTSLGRPRVCAELRYRRFHPHKLQRTGQPPPMVLIARLTVGVEQWRVELHLEWGEGVVGWLGADSISERCIPAPSLGNGTHEC